MYNIEEQVQAGVGKKNLYVEVIGEGPDLVLLHGWGLNSACWQGIVPLLSQHYRLHLIDLPGFGFSYDLFTQSQSLEDITAALAVVAPDTAIWLGWSLGGLCASHFALQYPERVTSLVTVASSPKFMSVAGDLSEQAWPGIKPDVLAFFEQQLQQNLTATISRFLAIQAMGSVSAKQDVKQLKSLLLLRPEPHMSALSAGLKLLAEVDLRDSLIDLTMPFHRFYGRLDSLVPQAVVSQIDFSLPLSSQYTFTQSSHAPFITEPNKFVLKLREFIGN